LDIFLQQIINGLVLGSIYALVALGYTMVYGILGLINFAHGDIVMVGAMVALSVVYAFAGSALPVAVVLIFATLAATVVCVALGLVATGLVVADMGYLAPASKQAARE
jgi:branched-chain amino acid transport system permease protein